jgi:hypothetical protein
MAPREFAQTISHLAVIQKNLPIRSDARKVVSTWRIPHVQRKLGVRLDRLGQQKEKKGPFSSDLRPNTSGMGVGAHLTR